MTSPYRKPAVQSKPRYARRKPAGPILVLTVIGLLFLAVAILLLPVTNLAPTDLEGVLSTGLWWAGFACVAIGLIIVALGCMGRRSGGLIPVAWITVFIMLSFIATSLLYSYAYSDWAEQRRIYVSENIDADITVDNGLKVLGSDPDTMALLEQGVAISGTSARSDIVQIDLTEYAENNGEHQITLNDGSTAMSSCPTGQINLATYNTRVYITIPNGCTWMFGTPDSGASLGRTYGSWWGAVSTDAWYVIGDDGATLYYTVDDVGTTYYETEDGYRTMDYYEYTWGDYEPDSPAEPELYINLNPAVISQVVVQYELENNLPTYNSVANWKVTTRE